MKIRKIMITFIVAITVGLSLIACAGNDNQTVCAHSGGAATCTEKATCTLCGEKYGELASHSGGAATCNEKATCSVCEEKYGEVDSSAHNYENGKCTACETDDPNYVDPTNPDNPTNPTDVIASGTFTRLPTKAELGFFGMEDLVLPELDCVGFELDLDQGQIIIVYEEETNATLNTYAQYVYEDTDANLTRFNNDGSGEATYVKASDYQDLLHEMATGVYVYSGLYYRNPFQINMLAAMWVDKSTADYASNVPEGLTVTESIFTIAIGTGQHIGGYSEDAPTPDFYAQFNLLGITLPDLTHHFSMYLTEGNSPKLMSFYENVDENISNAYAKSIFDTYMKDSGVEFENCWEVWDGMGFSLNRFTAQISFEHFDVEIWIIHLPTDATIQTGIEEKETITGNKLLVWINRLSDDEIIGGDDNDIEQHYCDGGEHNLDSLWHCRDCEYIDERLCDGENHNINGDYGNCTNDDCPFVICETHEYKGGDKCLNCHRYECENDDTKHNYDEKGICDICGYIKQD